MSINEPDNNVYRSLFEGSQASLADMAARQGQALSRVGRLRQSIVTILRKNYGPLVNSAEMSALLYLDCLHPATRRPVPY